MITRKVSYRRSDHDLLPTISVPPSASIREALAAINEGGVGTVLIVDEELALVGLATDGDVRRGLLEGHELGDSILDVANTDPVVAPANIGLDELSGHFSETVRAVPLIDGKRRLKDLAILERRTRLPVAEPTLSGNELRYVTDCIVSGWISSAGKYVREFEEKLADHVGVAHAVSTSSGTTALHLALVSMNLGPGDEVIVPSLTFIATANAVRYTGACPVFVDSEPETWNLDPYAFEEAITHRTRAVIPVHLYGHPADMSPILEIAHRHGITVIEDAAEAFGARYRGEPVGSIGDAAIFSFYGNKILTTGEGGMLVTESDELAERARLLRAHGMASDRRYWHPVLGYNFRLTNLQAAVGLAQLERAEKLLERRQEIADRYSAGLKNVPGIELPPRAAWADPVCWIYSVLVNGEKFGTNRDELAESLDDKGVETRPLFPPVHRQPIYDRGQRLPVAEELADRGLSLPSGAAMRSAEVDRVVEVIRGVAPRSPGVT